MYNSWGKNKHGLSFIKLYLILFWNVFLEN